MHGGVERSAVNHIHLVVNSKRIPIGVITAPARMLIVGRGPGSDLVLLCHLVERYLYE